MIKLEITANSVEEYKEILGSLVEEKLVPDLKVATDKTKEKVKSEKVEKEKEIPVAEKTLYFSHDGTGEVFKVEKGESLDFLDGREILEPVTKKAYDSYLKSLDDEEPTEEKEDKADSDKPTKDEMTNLIKACLDAGLRKEVVAAFGKFEAKKFPQVHESDYADLKEVLEELLA